MLRQSLKMLATTAVFTAAAISASAQDLVDTAVEAGEFSILVSAVQAAGLEEVLRGDGPYTIFAPSDAAFEALPIGAIEELLLPENKDQLISILTYHVVPGTVMAGDLVGAVTDVNTVQGKSLSVDGMAGVMVNDAAVTSADITASNGVIHTIDRVLIPQPN